MDGELLRPADALQRLEALERHLGGARHKLHQQRLVLLAHLLHHLPEPPAPCAAPGPKPSSTSLTRPAKVELPLLPRGPPGSLAAAPCPQGRRRGVGAGSEPARRRSTLQASPTCRCSHPAPPPAHLMTGEVGVRPWYSVLALRSSMSMSGSPEMSSSSSWSLKSVMRWRGTSSQKPCGRPHRTRHTQHHAAPAWSSTRVASDWCGVKSSGAPGGAASQALGSRASSHAPHGNPAVCPPHAPEEAATVVARTWVKALICCLMLVVMRCRAMRSTYWRLLASVTLMSLPPAHRATQAHTRDGGAHTTLRVQRPRGKQPAFPCPGGKQATRDGQLQHCATLHVREGERAGTGGGRERAPGTSSTTSVRPKKSVSAVKVSSSTSVMSFCTPKALTPAPASASQPPTLRLQRAQGRQLHLATPTPRHEPLTPAHPAAHPPSRPAAKHHA